MERVLRDDQLYMNQALELASAPAHTSPNPRVGAVVVRDGEVIGRGAHEGAGHPHAEVVALDGIDARGATIYLNLEPCNHQGRTEPCVPRVIASGVQRVVVAIQDPDRRVAGSGIDALRAGGVDVTVGVLEDAARRLNAPFIHHRSTGKSFLTLKLALSLDGKLGAPDGSSRWITGEEARRRVHARRLEADAVLVGAGTVIKDDPLLTVRDVASDRQPLRVVVDSAGRIPPSAAVFGREAETIVATTARCSHETQTGWKEAGADVLILPDVEGAVDVGELLKSLGERDVVETYCEGGATLATWLLRADLVERLELYRGPLLIGGSGPGIGSLGVSSMGDVVRWSTSMVQQLGEDTLVVLERRR